MHHIRSIYKHSRFKLGCAPDQFTCIDGSCIPGSYRCDEIIDCPFMDGGHFDETDCGKDFSLVLVLVLRYANSISFLKMF